MVPLGDGLIARLRSTNAVVYGRVDLPLDNFRILRLRRNANVAPHLPQQKVACSPMYAILRTNFSARRAIMVTKPQASAWGQE